MSESNADKPLIGIVGGIASGKSVVAEQFARQGAAVIVADRLAHEVLKQEDVKREVRKRWGGSVFAADGEVDRAALAKIVFAPPPAGPAELKFLEQLTHPRIGELALEQIARLRADPRVKAIVLDVPLLFEAGWNKFCTKIVYVDAPRDVRQARAATRGWSGEEFGRREALQENLDRKKQLADVVIDNSSSLQAAQFQTEQIWVSLVGGAEN